MLLTLKPRCAHGRKLGGGEVRSKIALRADKKEHVFVSVYIHNVVLDVS